MFKQMPARIWGTVAAALLVVAIITSIALTGVANGSLPGKNVEYKVIMLKFTGNEQDNAAKLETALNREAADGWQLDAYLHSYLIILKR